MAPEDAPADSADLFSPDDLPEPAFLSSHHRALAVIDAAIGGIEDDLRSFDYERDANGQEIHHFSNGSGDDYELVLMGNSSDALLTVFAHESHYSPYALEPEAKQWPGMYEGLPEHLAGELPVAGGGMHQVTACFWFTDDEWYSGNPKRPKDVSSVGGGDPQGVEGLCALLFDELKYTVPWLVSHIHGKDEDAAKAATAIAKKLSAGVPVSPKSFAALNPPDGLQAAADYAEKVCRVVRYIPPPEQVQKAERADSPPPQDGDPVSPDPSVRLPSSGDEWLDGLVEGAVALLHEELVHERYHRYFYILGYEHRRVLWREAIPASLTRGASWERATALFQEREATGYVFIDLTKPRKGGEQTATLIAQSRQGSEVRLRSVFNLGQGQHLRDHLKLTDQPEQSSPPEEPQPEGIFIVRG